MSTQSSIAIAQPEDAAAFLKSRLVDLPCETFACMFLDSQHALVAFETWAPGAVTNDARDSRHFNQRCLAHKAAAIVTAHNTTASPHESAEADRVLTTQLRRALHQIDVRLLDHFVVADGEALSLAKRGLL